MKILVFSSYLANWNVVRPEAEIFIEMAKIGHSITVATPKNAEYVSRFLKYGIHVIDCYPKRKICLKSIRILREELKRTSYNIVYATNSWTIPNAAIACMGLPVKLVTYRGTSHGLYRHDPSAYLTHLNPRVDAISCNAEAVRQDVVKRVWKNKDKVVTIYKGQQIEWFKNGKADIEQFGIPKHAFLVVCVANARPSKGIHVLIEACEELAAFDDIHVLIAGEGTDSKIYTRQIAKKAMRERIHAAGYRSDALQIIAAASIYVQPSIKGEGLSKTLPEAMAQRIPAIVTTTGGLPEMIVDGVTGFIVPKNNPKAIAEKIIKIYKNPDLMKKMGEAARNHLAEKFTIANSVKGHLALFSSLQR
jgi:glycosyltransferase involved in cell wall biosynthesis